jgi:hypothetical protein
MYNVLFENPESWKNSNRRPDTLYSREHGSINYPDPYLLKSKILVLIYIQTKKIEVLEFIEN